MRNVLLVMCIMLIGLSSFLGGQPILIWKSALEILQLPSSYSFPIYNKTISKSIDDIITEKSIKYGLPSSLLKALIKVESNFDPNAISPAGAIGLCQLMPGTARSMGVNPHSIDQNIEGGAKYLRDCYGKFGSLRKALWAYNSGPGNVIKNRIPDSTRKFASNVLYWYDIYEAQKRG